MVAAILNGAVIAESDHTVVVENNHYFPPDSVDKSVFTESSTQYVRSTFKASVIHELTPFSTTCPWKG